MTCGLVFWAEKPRNELKWAAWQSTTESWQIVTPENAMLRADNFKAQVVPWAILTHESM